MQPPRPGDERPQRDPAQTPGGASTLAIDDKSFLISPPAISLPKGGGAIRGIGEKFAANPVTGSASFSIPLPLSPARNGFGPQLSLTYDSAAGNGAFGFGLQLSLPAITRKTDKGLPRYLDAQESDVFLLSGAEDLVPVLDHNGDRVVDTTSVAEYVIDRYRPRVDAGFARIERWTHSGGDVHWRSLSGDNVLTIYGGSANSRIADAADARRVFSWLVSETRDDKGNAVVFDYKAEDGSEVGLTHVHERHRGDRGSGARSAQRYLKRIRYGNRKTLLDPVTHERPLSVDPELIETAGWTFEAVFDYGEHESLVLDGSTPWGCRGDPFSTYRAGFEVRTYRLCQRVLMFHHFPDDYLDDFPDDLEARNNCLVRSLDFSYRTTPRQPRSADPGYSFLARVTQTSYQRDLEAPTPEERPLYHTRSLPPIEFDYSEAIIDRIQDIDVESLANAPVGIGAGYQWIDLDGEGIAGILTEQAGAWFYKANLGAGASGPRFGPSRTTLQPSTAALNAGRQQLIDLQGDGTLDVVDFHPPLAGFYERDRDGGWEEFVPFASLPVLDWSNANLRFIDLTGDGRADILLTENEVLTWYPSQTEQGFGPATRINTPLDERNGPRIVFADGTEAIYLADMSGDGLTDIVRIRNGEVCYWPNLGYGRFGKQVVMDAAPLFDHADMFGQDRIRLADIDGSGTTDIIYLGRDGARVYFNRSGNEWSSARALAFPVATSNVDQIQVADLLGNGTACLVWSSDLPGDSRRPMRYLDLMGGQKPHLMTEMRNNLGAVTRVDYVASTKFYLRDKAAGTPWVTRLPFPVHCVEKVTVIDLHRKTTFTTGYSYHHGYFDGVEREFRGFGRVEQVDTERFDEFSEANRDSAFVAADQRLYQPPVKTVTWFHTGIATDRSRILGLYEREYFPRRYSNRLAGGGFSERELPHPDLEATGAALDADEWREAMRACKGMALRQEVYELDLSALHERDVHLPVRLFSAAQHNCHIRRLQPRGTNQHAVFLVGEAEAITYHYELALNGIGLLQPVPRVAHSLNLRFDDYGRAIQSVVAVYPRRGEHENEAVDPAPLNPQQLGLIRAVQHERQIVYTESDYTDELPFDVGAHRLPAPSEVRTYELTGIDSTGDYFTIEDFRSHQLDGAPDTQATAVKTVEYHKRPLDSTPHRRLIEHVAVLYFKEDLSGALDLGKQNSLGLVYETYKLALTGSLLDAVFTRTAVQDNFSVEARTALAAAGARAGFLASGYRRGTAIVETESEQWWLRSGVAGFASQAADRFYLPTHYIDPFGYETTVSYDDDRLFIQSSNDALGNVTTVEAFDHRVLAPSRLRDQNGNRTEAAFDIFGLAVATASMGHSPTETGETVSTMTFGELNPDALTVTQFFDGAVLDEEGARRWLGKATSRFVYHFGELFDAQVGMRWGVTAPGACGIQREVRERDRPNDRPDDPEQRIPVQIAFQYSDGAGQAFVTKSQAEPAPEDDQREGLSRWIANGKTIVNNKGNPVLQYEPYFTESGHRFQEPRAVGVSAVMFYDAPGRLVRTEFPDGTLSRVEFSPWFSRTFDQNDTVTESRWYRERLTQGERGPEAVPGTTLENDKAESASIEDERAARLAAMHAGTPAETHFDSQGRAVIAIAHNRVPLEDAAGPDAAPSVTTWPWHDEKYLTFTKLDAEGKPLWICDARGNLVMQYVSPPKANHTPLYDETRPSHEPAYDMATTAVPCYDIAGNLLFQHSMDSGDRRMLMDASGQPMLAWDFNERQDATSDRIFEEHRRLEMAYDALHRPLERRLRIRDAVTGSVQAFVVERFVYGEGRPDAEALNLRGQVWQHYDGSGLAQTDAFDLLGNPLITRRRLAADIEAPVVDWNGRGLDDVHVTSAAGFDGAIFSQRTEFDALGRMTRHYNWHMESPAGSGRSQRVAVYLPRYNRRGLLAEETLILRARKTIGGYEEVAGTTRTQKAIARIDYDAKGLRSRVDRGNGTTTLYDYDPDTLRLRVLRTTRPGFSPRFPLRRGELADERVLQHLHYVYDPAGNITAIHDDAWTPAFFRNQRVDAASEYVYDAIYRLVQATGRENSAASGAPPQRAAPPKEVGALPVQTADVLRMYTQRYRYDEVGNIRQMHHRAGAEERWTRDYDYATDSNHLTGTGTDNPATAVEYDYDTHGSMRNLNASPERFDLRWNRDDMIHTIDLGGGGRAWYQYGADKQRCRKQIARNPQLSRGTVTEDRIYLGGYELYRRYTSDPDVPVEVIESHHLFDGDERVLLVDDVLEARNPRPDGLPVRAQTLWRYQYGNHLGSVGLELDETRRVISYEEFHPYGTTAYELIDPALEAPSKRYCYSGLECDEESGMGYHGARSYATWIVRWVSFDPAGLTDSENGYLYVLNRPIALTDTSGYDSKVGATLSIGRRSASFQLGASIPDTESRGAAAQDLELDLIQQVGPPVASPVGGFTGGITLEPEYETFTSTPITPIGGFPLAKAGAKATSYYADLVSEGERQEGSWGIAKEALGWVGGFLAALWTPETASDTALTLSLGGVGTWAQTGRLGTLSVPVARGFALSGSFQTGLMAGQSMTGTDLSARPLPRLEHQLLTLNAIIGIASLGLSAAQERGWRTGGVRLVQDEFLTPKVVDPLWARIFRHTPEVLGGRPYSGHTIDRMTERGILPSMIEDAIAGGNMTVPFGRGTVNYYNPRSGVKVVTDITTGRIVTVVRQSPSRTASAGR